MIRLAIPLLHVSDPGSAENFYCNQLGSKKTFDYRPFGKSGPRYFGITRNTILIHIASFPEDGTAGNAIVLIVDNINAIYNEFISKYVKIDIEPTDHSWGNREMYIKDANGNSIRFTQPGKNTSSC